MVHAGGASPAGAGSTSSTQPYRSTWKTASKLGEGGELYVASLLRDLTEGAEVLHAEFTAGEGDEFCIGIEVGSGLDEQHAEATGGYRPTTLSGLATSEARWFIAWRGGSFIACRREDVLELAYGHLSVEMADGAKSGPRRGYMGQGEDGPVQMVTLTQEELLTAAGTAVPPTDPQLKDWLAPFKPENQGVTTSSFDISMPIRSADLDDGATSVLLRELAAPSYGEAVVLEVKNDDLWDGTGNYFSETRRRVWQGNGEYEDTGILISKAPWYALVFGRSILVAPTADLLDLTEARKPYRNGGDGGRARGAVIPLAELQAVSAGRLPTSVHAHLWDTEGNEASAGEASPEQDAGDLWSEDFVPPSEADLNEFLSGGA